jgi:hypothetical protein
MEDLLEKHQGTDGEEASAVMTTVQEVLQYVYVANDQAKCMLDDFGQKWSHTAQHLLQYADLAQPDRRALCELVGTLNV